MTTELLRPSDKKGNIGEKCAGCPHYMGDHFNNGLYVGCDGGIRAFGGKTQVFCMCAGFKPKVKRRRRKANN